MTRHANDAPPVPPRELDLRNLSWRLTHVEERSPEERRPHLDSVRRNARRLKRFAELKVGSQYVIANPALREALAHDAEMTLFETSFISWMLDREG